MLVEAAQGGSLSAFDRLAKAYRPGLVALARQFVQGEAANDVAQDALLIAYRALPGLDDPSRFRSWIGSIVRNRALRLISRTRETAAIDELVLAYAPSIVDRVVNDARSSEILSAVRALPNDIGAVTELHYIQDWKTTEIAEILGVPLTTVKWRLHVGRRLLKKRLGASIEDS